MPRVNVADAELKGPDGQPVKVKIIEADSIDGVSASIMIPEASAAEVAAALEGRTIVAANATDMPKGDDADGS